MKNLLLIAVIFVFGLSQAIAQNATTTTTTQTTTVVNPNAPKAKWDKTTSDFGEIEQGIPKEAEFKLTNEGKEPLLIQTAKAGCGCTNLKYSQEPVLLLHTMLLQWVNLPRALLLLQMLIQTRLCLS